MFNPHPYNEPNAINRPALSKGTVDSLVVGIPKIEDALESEITSSRCVIAFDGYPSADFLPLVNQISGLLRQKNKSFDVINVADYYKSAEELEKNFEPLFPEDKEKDPVLLFGRRIEGGFENVFDADKYSELLSKLRNSDKIVLMFGFGCTYSEELRGATDKIVYMDLAPKEVVLRARSGRMVNIGDSYARQSKRMMRRAYYVDFEIALQLRRLLLNKNAVDYYIDSTDMKSCRMVPRSAFNEITSALSKMPFRTRPVYIEGVWGGQYIKSLRKMPDTVKNVAWSFDFIPMEVSVVVEVGDEQLEMPFYTFLQSSEEAIMGSSCVEKFGGYFPIRFNYDDTFHSSGNMSIQVHSGAEYNKENFNEFGRQDESYYIVNAGHGAKTYVGFNNDIDPDEFIELAKKSEKEHFEIDYQKYVNGETSYPGLQVMIPAGTIHASGRNQVILEIGSLTVGSYTYKLYDYLRLDLDGYPRPIHTYHGERVLAKDRNRSWAKENIVVPPVVVREDENGRELVLGECDLLYFSLRQLEFEKEITDDTNGVFHVLSLVDGESVVVESIDHPELCYYQNYMDIIVVPSSVGRYRIRNLGNHPIKVHKTCLKNGFEND